MGLSRAARKLAGHANAKIEKAQGQSADEPVFVSPGRASEMTTLSGRQIDRLVAAGKFPKPVELSDRRIAFVKSEVLAWNLDRVAARGEA